jgi:hypothetical protein
MSSQKYEKIIVLAEYKDFYPAILQDNLNSTTEKVDKSPKSTKTRWRIKLQMPKVVEPMHSNI